MYSSVVNRKHVHHTDTCFPVPHNFDQASFRKSNNTKMQYSRFAFIKNMRISGSIGIYMPRFEQASSLNHTLASVSLVTFRSRSRNWHSFINTCSKLVFWIRGRRFVLVPQCLTRMMKAALAQRIDTCIALIIRSNWFFLLDLPLKHATETLPEMPAFLRRYHRH